MQYVFDFWKWRTQTLEKSISIATAIRLAAQKFSAAQKNPRSTSCAPVGKLAADKKKRTQRYKASNRKCGLRGLEEQPQTKFPAF